MTTHRLLQIYNLNENCSSKSRQLRKAASNVYRIGNSKGGAYLTLKAIRLENIMNKCRLRLCATKKTTERFVHVHKDTIEGFSHAILDTEYGVCTNFVNYESLAIFVMKDGSKLVATTPYWDGTPEFPSSKKMYVITEFKQ